MQFASPGDIEFEAIQSIGQSISITALLYIKNEESIEAAHQSIKKRLTSAGLNKQDLSKQSDGSICLSENQKEMLEKSCATICSLLQIKDEMQNLRRHSPNTVVYAKAVNSFVRQVMRLATLQKDGMLNFSSPGEA